VSAARILALTLLCASGARAAPPRAVKGLDVLETPLASGPGAALALNCGPGPAAVTISQAGAVSDALTGKSLGRVAPRTLSGAAVAGATTVLLAGDGRLGYADWGSSTTTLSRYPVSLPGKAANISMDRGMLFAWGVPEGEGDAVHEYEGNGSFERVLVTPSKISALALAPGRMLFSMDTGIYQRRADGSFNLLFSGGLVQAVRALAIDPATDIVYFSTTEEVYALRRGVADLILQEAGGELCMADGELRVLSSEALYSLKGLRKLLVRE